MSRVDESPVKGIWCCCLMYFPLPKAIQLSKNTVNLLSEGGSYSNSAHLQVQY